MYITHEDFNGQPLLIKQGALFLWGTPLLSWVDNGQIYQVYQLNDFYADMRYDEYTGRLVCVDTSTNLNALIPDLNQPDRQALTSTGENGRAISENRPAQRSV